MAKKEASKEWTMEEIVADVAAGRFRPIYFFMGDEPYFIDFLTEYILAHLPLTDEEKAFNLNILYGTDDMSVGKVISLARSYPMLGSLQVIIVKEAQKIRNLEEELLPYVTEPNPSSIVVINYKGKKLDQRRKIASELQKNGVVFTSNILYDNQIPSWITDWLRREGLQIETKAAQMLADFLGTDLGRIVGELTKLKIVMPKGAALVTADLVERNVGISKDFNNFELSDAIKNRDLTKALYIAAYFAKNPKDHAMPQTTAMVFEFFSKLLIYQYLVDKNPYNAAAKLAVKPFAVRGYETAAQKYSVRKTLENISIVREFDARSKGFGQASGSVSDGDLLREMLCRLMN